MPRSHTEDTGATVVEPTDSVVVGSRCWRPWAAIIVGIGGRVPLPKKLLGGPKRKRPPTIIATFSKQKLDNLGGSESAHSTVLLVDESSPDIFFAERGRNRSRSITCLSDFGYLYPFQRYLRAKFEVVRNRPKFCTFLAPNFFWGRAPQILGPNLSNTRIFR